MTEPLADAIMQKLEQAALSYHRLILVVAPAGAGKTAALREVGVRLSVAPINVNLAVSSKMLDLTARQRTLQLSRLLTEAVDTAGTDIVLFDNLELLFDVSLQQDPLRLLQGLARHKTVVATWNGTVAAGYLTYAVPEHREYRRYPADGLLLVSKEVRQ